MPNRKVEASLASFADPGLLSRASQMATFVEDKRLELPFGAGFQDVLHSKPKFPKRTQLLASALRNPLTK